MVSIFAYTTVSCTITVDIVLVAHHVWAIRALVFLT